MTFSYDIHPEQRVIVARYTGKFSLSELTDATKRIWEDPRYSKSYDGLLDLTDISLGVDMADFRGLVDFVRNSDKVSQGRWAAVTTTPFATACSLLYQKALMSRHTFEVFSTMEGACSYLGLQATSGGEWLRRKGAAN